MAIFAVLFFLCGCAGKINSLVLKEDIIKEPSKGHFIRDVPFFPQGEFYCGPASIAMVLNFYGFNLAQEEIAKEIYLKKLKGALNIDLLRYAKEKGVDAAYYNGDLEDLKINISKNRPLILFLNLGYDIYPAGHYIVVIGFHDEKGFIIAHSGKDKEKVFSYKELLNAWRKTSFGTLRITLKKNER